VAGLIKAALCLQHGMIPPTLHAKELSEKIPWSELPLEVQRELGPWPELSRPRRAGVSAFGISGTNAHVVLEQAPARRSPLAAEAGRVEILPLSAYDAESLGLVVRAHREYLDPARGTNGAPSFHDICYSAGVRRGHYAQRVAFVGRDRRELCDGLDAFLAAESAGDRDPEAPSRLVFVFSGQGSQWLGMGLELARRELVFRDKLEQCDRAIRLHADWSLLEELAADASHSRLDRVDVVQPAIFAMQVSLAALWRSWGIEPDAVIGQSLGEVAAAHVAGALSLEDAACVICRRSQLVGSTRGGGAMAVVGLTLEQAAAQVADEERVSVAVSSSPASTVLSGDREALVPILDRLEKSGTFCRWINVDYASHGPQMESLRESLPQALAGIQPRPADVAMYSTVTRRVCDGTELDASYWYRNIREPVLFSDVVKQLLEDDHRLFLEVSPHPVLTSAVQQCLTACGHTGAVLPSTRKDEDERSALLEGLAELYAAGLDANWSALYLQGGTPVRLPRYPRRSEHYWFEQGEPPRSQAPQASKRSPIAASQGHPLLGVHIQSAIEPGTHFWETELGVDVAPYLVDHRVRGSMVLPASAYVEMALAAAEQVFGAGPHALENVSFQKALFLPEQGTCRVQLVITAGAPGQAAFRLLSHGASANGKTGLSTVHATGTIRLDESMDSAESAGNGTSPAGIRDRCDHAVSADDHYRAMQARGLQYGPTFQAVEEISRKNGEAIGRLRLHGDLSAELSAYKVHPALLDGCFQVLATMLPDDAPNAGRDTWLPIGVTRVRLNGSTVGGAWGHAVIETDHDEPGVLRGDVCLVDEQGRKVLEVSGMSLQRLEGAPTAEKELDFYEIEWRSQPLERIAPPAAGTNGHAGWIVLTDGSGGLGEALAERIEAHGESCVRVSRGDGYASLGDDQYRVDPTRSDDFDRLLRDAFGGQPGNCRGLVHLGGLDAAPPQLTTLESLDADLDRVCGGALHLVQALERLEGQTKSARPRLVLVTRGVQSVGAGRDAVSVAQSTLWGLGRVIANEHPEMPCRLIDLAPVPTSAEAELLHAELHAEDGEEQIALREDDRLVARLVPRTVESEHDQPAEQARRMVPAEHPYRLDSTAPGILDNLVLREFHRGTPAPGEVEIHVQAAGLNFSDVMKAMGIYPSVGDGPLPLGIECSGRVTAVGEGVTRVRPGDEVLAAGYHCFGSYVTTRAELVMLKPDGMSFAQAASVPIAFLTAYYALHHLGRLARGERVLIHSATGGVGLAAVQIARLAGAEIFATAGTDEKRAFLRELGIEHVMDSRSMAFAEQVLQATNGQGVDLVLNSLAGEAIPKGLSILRSHGRFLELGKRDIYDDNPVGLAAFKNNVAFFAIDLDQTVRERPELVGDLCDAFMEHLKRDEYQPLPVSTYSLSRAAEAFRFMAQAKHIGKVVLAVEEPEVAVLPESVGGSRFRPDGTYLITGGLGGIGLATAEWMSQRGAGNLALIGRSGASSAAEPVLESMRRNGARVEVIKADVADSGQIGRALEQIAASMPPLRGVIHAAGILDDGVLGQQSLERFRSVMAPKVSGAWNLHSMTADTPLDFFVLFSSASSVFGSAGQSNYSAANTFLDALAHHRRALGRPAVAINWGAWGEVGLASRPDRIEWLKRQGVLPFSNRQGLDALGRLLQDGPAQTMVNSVNWSRYLDFLPRERDFKLLAELGRSDVVETPAVVEKKAAASAKPATAAGEGIREQLLTAPADQRRELLEAYLQKAIAKVLGLTVAKLNRQRSQLSLGLDSLMATEIRNRIEATLGVVLPVTTLLQGCSVADLAGELLDQLPTEAPSRDERLSSVLEQVDKLTPEEARALLAKKKSEQAQRRTHR